jgi:dTDP-4-dehydrorhamnose 3,5-epimerase-like enzyme
MAYLIDLKTYTDKRGNLTVIENVLPFKIKRIFYIYGVDGSVRGGHRHHKTIQAAICIKGKCKIFNNDGQRTTTYTLRNPSQCLVLEQKDWHKMFEFSKNAILMVLASENFDEKDYIFEKYED